MITGGSGFIGTNLVEDCVAAGHEVLNLDARPPRNAASRARFVQLDILDARALLQAIREFSPDYIFHLAARTDLDGSSESDYAANTAGVSNVIAAAKTARSLKRAVFASSMYVCRLGYVPENDFDYCPHTVYGQSKVAGEDIVRREAAGSFCWAIVRPTSIWGPWFDVPYRGFFEAVRKGLYVHPKGLQLRRSYGFVLNTVHQLNRLALTASDCDVHGKLFYLADYEPLDSRRWAELIAAAFGAPNVREVPLSAMRVAAWVGDMLKVLGVRNPPLTSFRLRNLTTDSVFDLSPIRRVAGDTPYSLEAGVDMTIAWIRERACARFALSTT